MKSHDVIFVIGPTGSGKTFIINHAVKKHDAYPVLVGKILREKYKTQEFQGKGCPEHLVEEACNLMIAGVQDGINKDKGLIIVDGMPRHPRQCDMIFREFFSNDGLFTKNCEPNFLYLNCDNNIRSTRLTERDSKNVNDKELSDARFLKDIEDLKSVIFDLTINKKVAHKIHIVEAKNNEKEFDDYYKMILFNDSHNDFSTPIVPDIKKLTFHERQTQTV